MFNPTLAHSPPPFPTTTGSLGKAGWVKCGALIYLFVGVAHSSAVTNDPGGWRPLNPPTPPSPVLPSSASLRHDLCVINIKNTQITEEQWIPLEAEDTEQRCKLFFFLSRGKEWSACHRVRPGDDETGRFFLRLLGHRNCFFFWQNVVVGATQNTQMVRFCQLSNVVHIQFALTMRKIWNWIFSGKSEKMP